MLRNIADKGYKDADSANWAKAKYGSDGVNVVTETAAPLGSEFIIIGVTNANDGPVSDVDIFSAASTGGDSKYDDSKLNETIQDNKGVALPSEKTFKVMDYISRSFQATGLDDVGAMKKYIEILDEKTPDSRLNQHRGAAGTLLLEAKKSSGGLIY